MSRKSKFSEQEIVYALKQVEAGVPLSELYRKYGVSEQTFYRWRSKYGGLSASELETWQCGSVIGSWLLDLTAAALAKSPDLAAFTGRVSDSGEGRWTMKTALDEGVPAPVLNTALTERFASRGEEHFGDKVLSAMRYQFGVHEEKHS